MNSSCDLNHSKWLPSRSRITPGRFKPGFYTHPRPTRVFPAGLPPHPLSPTVFLWEPEVIDRVYTLPAQPEHETASQTLNNSSAIHIVIADDHPVVRRGVKQILEEQPDMKVVGEAQDAIETLELIHKQPCHILILDLAMPGGGGMGVLRQLQREGSQLPVLVLSIQSAEQYAQQVLRAGAAGYLTKESAPEELVSPSGMVESPRLLGEGKFGEM